MNQLRWWWLASLTALCGCAALGIKAPNPLAKEEETQEETGDEPSFAGKWTRDDGKVFEVSDDGSSVHGEMIEGDTDGYFESYTFDLNRGKKGNLEGKAKFAFKDEPGKSYTIKWKVKKKGDDKFTLTSQVLEFDDDGSVVNDKDSDTQAIAFEASAAAGAAAASYTPPAVDMSSYVQAMPTYKYMLYDGIEVGHWVEVETISKLANTKGTARISVVGESGGDWILEMDNQMNQKDLLIAVFVDKESGLPQKAFVGNRGKDGKEKAVPPPPEEQTAKEPQWEEEEVSVGAGDFNSRKYEASGTTTWSGMDGDAEGILLKMSGTNIDEELLELNTGVDLKAAGKTWTTKHLKYKSGNEMWYADPDDKPYLNQQLKMVMAAAKSTMTLVGQGEDAKPEFKYPR